jgi:HSP20 family molecular chaperone IbpA
MCPKNNKKPFQTDEVEKWLESFFLDPFTSILDQTLFQVDIFETDTELIIEALLPHFHSNEISVYLEGSQVRIKAGIPPKSTKERTITFPFNINTQKISAAFSNEILEITISKVYQERQHNRNIPLI